MIFIRHASKQTQSLRKKFTHFRTVLAEEDWSDVAVGNYTHLLDRAYWEFFNAVPKV